LKLNDNEQKVLEILREDPFVSQLVIAKKLDLSRPSVANLISGLQEKGMIIGKPYLLREEEYVTCIGGANLDYTFRLEGDLVMHTSNPVRSKVSYGGVVRNIAENLARLGNNVSLMALVGDDASGEELLRESRKLMQVFASEKVPNKTTGGYYSIIQKDGNMTIGYADMSINDLMDRSWIMSHQRHLHMSSWMIADMNMSKDALERLIEFHHEEEKHLAIVGVSGPKMANLPDNLTGVDIIICNLDESQAYFHTSETNPTILAQYWLDKGVKKIVVTIGEDGCVYGENKKIMHQESFFVPKEDIVDVTGAGDAFSGALLHGLMHQHSFERSIKYGAIGASLAVQSLSSVHPKLSINMIKKELKKYE